MTNQDLQFRPAKLSDLPILLELEQAVVEAERPFNTDLRDGKPKYYDIEQLINEINSLLLVATSNGHIVGTGYSQIRQSTPSLQHEQHAYLGFMYVDPSQRGKGVIQTIIEKLIDWSGQQKVNAIYLDVYSGNEAAIRAYQKAGFESSMIEMKLKVTEGQG